MYTTVQRKIELLKRGVTVTALASAIGYKSRARVSNVINGKLRHPRIEAAICWYLGVDRSEWFPPVPTDSVDQAA